MSPPILGTNISLTQLEVQWIPLIGISTGGATINSYEIQYDDGTNGVTWTSLQGGIGSFTTSLSILVTSLSSNVTYQFKVRAHNDMGWGTFSSVASFYTYDYPDAPTSVTTAYNNMNIRISWVSPITNYKPIEEY